MVEVSPIRLSGQMLAYWFFMPEVSGSIPTDDKFFYLLSQSAFKAVALREALKHKNASCEI